jgi:hypothetical protein
MKSLLLASSVLVFLSFNHTIEPYCESPASHPDTGHITHVLDGLVTEWPANTFQSNNDSTIEFAADNDDKNMYVAMSIPDFDMQMKLMRNGMKLFIDTKGKKKEGKGIDFPIKGEASNFVAGSSPPVNSNDGNNDPQKKKFDKKAARTMMSLGLNAIKIFGLGDNGQDEQGLVMPGSVNIAFKWDASDVMHIEYTIPLSLLGESSSLNQKDISLGWKINAYERPARTSPVESGEGNGGVSVGGGGGGYSRGGMGGGRGRGGGGGGRGYGGARESRRLDPDEMKKEESFWTKYIINILPAQKAF